MARADTTQSKRTLAAIKRREVEDRTGAVANMGMLGFYPVKYALTGEVTRWSSLQKQVPIDVEHWIIQRTPQKQWRISYCSGRIIPVKQGGYRHGVPAEVKLGNGITFPGPVAAAMWLEVEKANGNGTGSSKGAAGAARTVLRNDHAQHGHRGVREDS
ncbi:hypothetical protein D3C81_759310 [compost metagenome]